MEDLVNYPSALPGKAIEIICTAVMNPSSLKDQKTKQEVVQAAYTLEGYLLHHTIGSCDALVGSMNWKMVIKLLLSLVTKSIDSLSNATPSATKPTPRVNAAPDFKSLANTPTDATNAENEGQPNAQGGEEASVGNPVREGDTVSSGGVSSTN